MTNEDYLSIAEKNFRKLKKIIGDLEEHPKFAVRDFNQFDEAMREYQDVLPEIARVSQIEFEIHGERMEDMLRRYRRILERAIELGYNKIPSKLEEKT